MKRIQLTLLSLTGTACALIGALLLMIASVPMLTSGQDSPNAVLSVVYIGTDGCYTCHIDANSLWTDAIEPRLIDDAVMNPQAVAPALAVSLDAIPIGAADDALSYRALLIDVSPLTNYRFGSGTNSSSTPQESKP